KNITDTNRADATVKLFEHPRWQQPSVIAEIPGTGQYKDEIVVIGAHEDSINIDPGKTRAPGADDDASGVAALLEIHRTLLANGYQPARTIHFITYAAEEVGLYGSQAIAQSYKRAKKKVVGVVQFDMTMFPGSGQNIVFMTDFINRPMTKFVEAL